MYTQLFSLLALAGATMALPQGEVPPPPSYTTTTSSSTTSPTPVNQGPASLGISLSPSTDCSVLASGYPTGITSGICYALPAAGVQSFTYYSEPSSYGRTTIFESADCGGNGTAYSLERLGCSGDIGFVGHSVLYERNPPHAV